MSNNVEGKKFITVSDHINVTRYRQIYRTPTRRARIIHVVRFRGLQDCRASSRRQRSHRRGSGPSPGRSFYPGGHFRRVCAQVSPRSHWVGGSPRLAGRRINARYHMNYRIRAETRYTRRSSSSSQTSNSPWFS